MAKTKITLLKLTSWIFRIIGLGCIAFGVYFMFQVTKSRTSSDYYDIMPEFYTMMLAGSIFIPAIAGLFSFIISGLIDLRVAIIGSNKPTV